MHTSVFTFFAIVLIVAATVLVMLALRTNHARAYSRNRVPWRSSLTS
jgi:hypothetical protein